MVDRRTEHTVETGLSLHADSSAMLAYIERDIQLPTPHMTARERLKLLTVDDNGITPDRRVDIGTIDPTGLLEVEDTYEILAHNLFQECEGIYKQCVLNTPSV